MTGKTETESWVVAVKWRFRTSAASINGFGKGILPLPFNARSARYREEQRFIFRTEEMVLSQVDRRNFLKAAAGAASALPLAGPSEARTAQVLTAGSSKRPNLVYVFADQLRYFSCGYAGDEYARTPHIDQLAREGCNFHQAISSTPVCAPYRASLMTGKYQSSTGM